MDTLSFILKILFCCSSIFQLLTITPAHKHHSVKFIAPIYQSISAGLQTSQPGNCHFHSFSIFGLDVCCQLWSSHPCDLVQEIIEILIIAYIKMSYSVFIHHCLLTSPKLLQLLEAEDFSLVSGFKIKSLDTFWVSAKLNHNFFVKEC